MPCGRMGFGLANLWALAGENVQQKPDSEAADKVFTHCPECNWKITGDFSWCPKCGRRLRPFQCEYCKNYFSREKSECPHCGAPPAQMET